MNRYYDDYATKEREADTDHTELFVGVIKALLIGFSIAIILTILLILIIGPMILTTFLLLSVPLAVELASDRNRIVNKKKTDNHAPDVVVRGILYAVFAVLDAWTNQGGITWLNVGQAFLLGVAWFWLLFDYALNIIAFKDRPVFSLGDSSWMDKKIAGIPWYMVLFAKIWLFGVAIGVYYYWDMIVHAWPK